MYVFVTELKVYIEQGGDILNLSSQLINQVNHLNQVLIYLLQLRRENLENFRQFGSLVC